ncbi:MULTISPECIES: NAD-dependent malic enzyme [Actinomyces]|uniref:NAD-dependent malic enzyme n=1 Tax=Actinomyces respiraculi TaxID=2744574 RepID=A0A7T0LMW3_9ACTO|nr:MULTISPECIES: NAD-dependent malic enzyme [Actinomyces]QPL06048.1 NAD-dependent malic enzyme [Actinomyces respiraculi]
MAQPGPSYTVALHLEVPASQKAIATLVDRASSTGAIVNGVDVADADGDVLIVDLTADTRDSAHRQELVEALRSLEGVTVHNVGDSTFLAHVGGKLEIAPRTAIRNRRDLARVYTPGVARVCKAIHDHPERARHLTIKKNTVAVVTDGTAVLGLGDIGPAAAMPVMEGKAVLFKQFGDVDAWPVALDTKDPDEIVSIVKAIAPAYGGINLEDIAAPKCFDIEERLKAELGIPVFHDDQHGTAIVTLAALINALKIVDKRIEDVRIVLSGVGAAGTAIAKLLMAHGARDIVGYGRDGALDGHNTEGMNQHRRWLAENTNPRHVTGSLKEGLVGADVFIGVSSGNLLQPEDLDVMADNPIVFAMANPVPEVDPVGTAGRAAVLATGRSDFPNQINNVLVFPGLFRGLLDTGLTDISMNLMRAAATGIAGVIAEAELSPVYIIPGAFDTRVAGAVAEAVRQFANA